MRFALDLVWLGADGAVVRVDRDVAPRRHRWCRERQISGRAARRIARIVLLGLGLYSAPLTVTIRHSAAFLTRAIAQLVPVPRRFDRRPPERDTTRINERIRVPEVRVIGEDGKQIGVMRTDEALPLAQERDLDLVEVAPEARPPVTPHPRLLEVQVRAGPEAEAGAQAPAADHDPRDQVPPEDRRARLRDEEGPRRALPAPQGQGQDHDHVPRARGHAPRARRDDPRPPRRGAAELAASSSARTTTGAT